MRSVVLAQMRISNRHLNLINKTQEDLLLAIRRTQSEGASSTKWVWHFVKCGTNHTDEAQLRKLQDHPVLGRELEGKVLHGGKVVGLGHDVVLQLREQRQTWVSHHKPAGGLGFTNGMRCLGVSNENTAELAYTKLKAVGNTSSLQVRAENGNNTPHALDVRLTSLTSC